MSSPISELRELSEADKVHRKISYSQERGKKEERSLRVVAQNVGKRGTDLTLDRKFSRCPKSGQIIEIVRESSSNANSDTYSSHFSGSTFYSPPKPVKYQQISKTVEEILEAP
ncbi:hypothetical protein M413DRAFT_32930 [Hebeloma cylindrosporum]|uniref:Uncharacterized protein n=1 Tax=Hebeloma cylindrosporum TaxID=76867 RepID=A0A0C3BS66_HEBCY|nr:hypothetical protein M413DRAFT_32930 [Hebeloma cylindrosporum h7]